MSLLLITEANKPYIYYQLGVKETHIKRCKDLGTKA